MAVLLVPAALAAGPVLKSETPKPKSKIKPDVAVAPTNVVPEIPQSVFFLPSANQAVKDPFFPNSTRFAAVVATTVTNRAAVIVADLVLKGLAGRADAPLATINNVTLGVGEERDVVTPSGRIRVRCVQINLGDETVVIEAGGGRRELGFPRRK